MITFDNYRPKTIGKAELDAWAKGSGLPDRIEVGENNDVWFCVRRSTKMLEFRSKVTGKYTPKCRVDASDKEMSLLGMTPAQIGSARSVLKL